MRRVNVVIPYSCLSETNATRLMSRGYEGGGGQQWPASLAANLLKHPQGPPRMLFVHLVRSPRQTRSIEPGPSPPGKKDKEKKLRCIIM